MDDNDVEDIIKKQLEERDIPYSSVSVTHSELYIRCPEKSDASKIGAIVRRLLDPGSLRRLHIEYGKNGGVDHRVVENWKD